jgi:predicted GIY-YIG superfamily endonuclease
MVFVYALQLKDGKYYIGKTEYSCIYFDKICNNIKSKWIQLYKPLKLFMLIPFCNDYDEDKYVKIFMKKYGINNVRGGSFCSVYLTDLTITKLEKILNDENKCFICINGHSSINCNEYKNWDIHDIYKI